MKKIKFLIYFTLFTLFSGAFFQCGSVCDCPDNVKPYISIDGIGVFHRDIAGAQIVEQSNVKLSSHHFVMPALTSFTAETKELNFANPFINNALACSCSFDGELGLKTKIDTVLFTLMTDYDSEYKKGDCINKIIEVEDRGSFPLQKITFKNFIVELNNNAFFTGERFAFFIEHSKEFRDKVDKKNGVPFKVAAEIKFKNGTNVKGESYEINFYP